jgi:hypothetical protein
MRRRRDDRGAVILEFALVLPLLLLLAFGTAEMGLAWTAANRVEGAASTAARVGASVGQVVDPPAPAAAPTPADNQILVALQAALPEESLENLDRVIIFEADTNGDFPANCDKPLGSSSDGGVAGRCNSYSGATVRGVTLTSNLGAADEFWPDESRLDSLADPPDSLGVYVRTTHEAKTGTFWDDRTIERTSIYRLQPGISG